MIPSLQSISDCLRREYGIHVATLHFLPLGADPDASVFRAQAVNGQSYFIKVKKNYDHDLSLAVTELLQSAGLEQTILPIKTLQAKSACCLEEARLLVYPFIEGEDGFQRELTDEQWLILGKALRQIHDIQLPLELQRKLRKERYSDRFRKAVVSILDGLDKEPARSGVADKLNEYIKDKQQSILKLATRAQALSQKLQTEKCPFVLCHADIHGGNVLIDTNHALYIVDWDEPMLAPRERDLMFIGGGVANVWNKPHQEKFFYQGYGEVAVRRELIAYYRNERIVEDIALIYQQVVTSSLPEADKEISYKHFVDMFSPNGVVDIANAF